MLMLSDFCQNWNGLLGENYLTGYGIKNFLASYLQKEFEKNASALAVNFIVVDWRNKNDPFLWFINFDGGIKQLKNFTVAGGSEYEKPLTKEELEKLAPEEKAIFDIQKERLKKAGMPKEFPLTLNRLRYPRKDAIAYLEKNWKPDMEKKEAINLVKETLFECNPESHDKKIEIIAIEYGKEAEPFYFQKDDKKTKKNKNKK
jgi:20S proteasome alpha/beta subunit